MKIIKMKIIEKNLTIKKVANTLECNQQTITNWVNDRNVDNIKLFIKLCQYLGIEIKDLIK